MLCVLIYSCEDQPVKKNEPQPVTEKSKGILEGYKEYKGPSPVSNFTFTSSTPDPNARTTEGISVKRKCSPLCANNTIFDYNIDIAVGVYEEVAWYLFNPLDEYIYLGSTRDPYDPYHEAHNPIWQSVSFDLCDPSPFGNWRVYYVAYTYVVDDPLEIFCGPYPPGPPCHISNSNSMYFSVPMTGVFASSGSSSDLDAYRDQYNYTLPAGYTAADVLDIAIDYENNYVFTWFKDGMRCSGTTSNLAAHTGPTPFTLPPGYNINQIVAIDIDGDVERAYTWYTNGKRSIGSSTDLDRYGAPVNYTLPAGYSPSNIIDIAIDGNVNWSWVYFTNGKKCAGSTTNLSAFSGLANYAIPCNYTTSDIVGIACDGDINTIYAWYRK